MLNGRWMKSTCIHAFPAHPDLGLMPVYLQISKDLAQSLSLFQQITNIADVFRIKQHGNLKGK